MLDPRPLETLGECVDFATKAMEIAFKSLDVDWWIEVRPQDIHSPVMMIRMRVRYGRGRNDLFLCQFAPARSSPINRWQIIAHYTKALRDKVRA